MGLSPTEAVRPRISSRDIGLFGYLVRVAGDWWLATGETPSERSHQPPVTNHPTTTSSHTTFERNPQQLLRFQRELHRQLLEHFLAEAADDHAHRLLRAESALLEIEDLILADL